MVIHIIWEPIVLHAPNHLQTQLRLIVVHPGSTNLSESVLSADSSLAC